LIANGDRAAVILHIRRVRRLIDDLAIRTRPEFSSAAALSADLKHEGQHPKPGAGLLRYVDAWSSLVRPGATGMPADKLGGIATDPAMTRAGLEPATCGLKGRGLRGVSASLIIGKLCGNHDSRPSVAHW